MRSKKSEESTKKTKRLGRQTPTTSVVRSYSITEGAEAVKLYNSSGNKVREWQELMLYDLLAKNDEDLWVHTKAGYSVPRRNGKGEVLIMRELYGLKKGEKIMHTAHRTSTSHSAWERLLEVVTKAGIEIESEYRAMGKEHIFVKGGGRIEFRTRSAKGGLGEGFDLLVIDEAQEYQDDQESALKYVVSDSMNPQTIMCGTPPTASSSGTVFTKFRSDTLTGANNNTYWAEWGVEKMTDQHDVDAWYETNPSMGYQLTERKVADEIGQDEVDFNIQRLGLWLRYSQASCISLQTWEALQIGDDLEPVSQLFVGIKYGVDATNVAMSIAVKTAEGKIFVEAIGCHPIREGNKWILDFLRQADWKKVTIDGRSGQDVLVADMKRAKLKRPVIPTVKEVVVGNTLFEQAIEAKTFCHNGQPSLTEIATNCEKRLIGQSGGFGYKSIRPEMEIAVLDSIVLAHWLASEDREVKQQARY